MCANSPSNAYLRLQSQSMLVDQKHKIIAIYMNIFAIYRQKPTRSTKFVDFHPLDRIERERESAAERREKTENRVKKSKRQKISLFVCNYGQHLRDSECNQVQCFAVDYVIRRYRAAISNSQIFSKFSQLLVRKRREKSSDTYIC